MWGLDVELPGLGLGFYGKVSVSKFGPGLGLGGYGLDYSTVAYTLVQARNQLEAPGVAKSFLRGARFS